MQENISENRKLNIVNALFSSVCVLVLFVGVAVLGHITPFGDKTFLMFDLKRQYVDYYAYLRTILSGENNVFYSFSATLGSSMPGFIAYYLTSPFLLILSLFGRQNLAVGISIVICLKLMLAAFIMDIYLQKTVHSVRIFSVLDTGNIAVLTGAVSYSFSGFLFAHSMNMMWIDVILLFPLLMLTLEMILDGKSRIPFILLLLYMLILNYYITYQVILFTALWTVMRVIVRRDEKPVSKVVSVAVSGIVSGLLSAAILLPTALELLDSPKDIKKLGLETTGHNISAIDIFSKLPTLAYDYDEPMFGYPQIFCGVLLTILVLLFFLGRNVTKREKTGMLAMFAIFLLSFSFDIVNLVWHAGMEPSGHPYRQAFFWVFMVCICSTKALLYLKDEMTGLKLGVIFSILIAGMLFIRRGNYDHISNLTMLVNVFLILLYTCAFILILQERITGIKELALKVVVPLLFVVNCADLAANALYTYRIQSLYSESEQAFSEKVEETLEAVSYVKESDDTFYRMEDLNPRQQNDGLMFNYNGITHYSSAGKIYARYFLQRLGFNEDMLFTHYGHDNTVSADSLLGIKYVLTDGTYDPHPEYERVYEGAVSAFENSCALPVAIGTDSFNPKGISDASHNTPDTDMSHVPKMDALSLQENIYENLIGRELHLFAAAAVEQSGALQGENGYYCDYEAVAQADGEMFFYLDGLIGAFENLSVYVDDEFFTTYGNAACVKILNLGYKKKGESVALRVEGDSAESNFGTAVFVTEDFDAVKEACEELRQKETNVTKLSSSHLSVKTGDVNGVLITIPFEKGWSIKVDGVETYPVAVYDSLMYVPLEKNGSGHTIDMTFVPDGIGAGIAISLIGVILLAVIVIMEKKQKK